MSKETRFIVGVIKFGHKGLGYPQISSIAQEWSKDESFLELLIRRVSDTDFGIQFVYKTDEKLESGHKTAFWQTYIDPLIEKVGRGKQGIYAWDISTGVDQEDILIFKGLDLTQAEEV